MWYINLVCFFQTKMMEIIKIHFEHYPLQLGIVLVNGNRLFYLLTKQRNNMHKYSSSRIKVPQFLYLTTAYTVWANKLKFKTGSLHMIISKCFFCCWNFHSFPIEPPFFIFHNFLYIKAMNVPIKTHNVSN